MIFQKYFKPEDRILDIGCGAGRATLGLHLLGFKNTEGLDLSDDLIFSARKIADEKELKIKYHIGNALDLPFEDNEFNSAIFSYNGLMQIPGESNRLKVMKEIKRVIKEKGYFIFTTHEDREKISSYKDFWKDYKVKWDNGQRDERLIDFGDIIFKECGEDCFIHLPIREEVTLSISSAGFTLKNDVLRSKLCNESDKVKEFSCDCRFWILQK